MNYLSRLDEDDRRMIGDAVERLAQSMHSIERCRSSNFGCSDADLDAFANLGLFGIGIEEAYGGIGGGARDLALVMREIGKNLLSIPFLDSVVIGAGLVGMLGSEDRKRGILGQVAAGKWRLSLAHREPDSGDIPGYVNTRADDRHRLSGRKIHVMDGAEANQLIVSARDGAGTLRLFLVDRGAEGLAFQNYRLSDNRYASAVDLEGVQGEPLGGGAEDAIATIFDRAALCLAAETCGAMSGLNQVTLDYAKTRRQFGQPIGQFQVLQHRLVDMFIGQRMVEALVDEAAGELDCGGSSAALMVSAAKVQADRLGRQIAEQSIQIHGGMGLTDECAAGHYLKRIVTNGSLYGTAGWHAGRITDLVA